MINDVIVGVIACKDGNIAMVVMIDIDGFLLMLDDGCDC